MTAPTAEIVTVAWLRDALSTQDIGTIAPDAAKWTGDTYAALASVGGDVDRSVPIRSAVIQVDCYARRPATTANLAWNRAYLLAEKIRLASYRVSGIEITPTGYDPVWISSVYMLTEPRRLVDDPGGLARYTFDLHVVFTVVDESA